MGGEIVAVLSKENGESLPIIVGQETPIDKDEKTAEIQKDYGSQLGSMAQMARTHIITKATGYTRQGKNGIVYDPAQKDYVEEALKAGIPVIEIAKDMKLTAPQLRGGGYTSGGSRISWSLLAHVLQSRKRDKQERMRSDLADPAMTNAQIAAKHGVSIMTVSNYRNELRLNKRTDESHELLKARAKRLLAEHPWKSVKEIAREAGLGSNTVYAVYHQGVIDGTVPERKEHRSSKLVPTWMEAVVPIKAEGVVDIDQQIAEVELAVQKAQERLQSLRDEQEGRSRKIAELRQQLLKAHKGLSALGVDVNSMMAATVG